MPFPLIGAAVGAIARVALPQLGRLASKTGLQKLAGLGSSQVTKALGKTGIDKFVTNLVAKGGIQGKFGKLLNWQLDSFKKYPVLTAAPFLLSGDSKPKPAANSAAPGSTASPAAAGQPQAAAPPNPNDPAAALGTGEIPADGNIMGTPNMTPQQVDAMLATGGDAPALTANAAALRWAGGIKG